jgi:NAD(P)-dependent dehydrogenase (short-subunit alcohol dehydrogenase family)
MAGELDDKVVVITGAGGGVGQIVTQQVSHTGAKLALWDRSVKPMDEIDCGEAPVERIQVDLTEPASVASAVEATVATYGRIDALMHIAGGFAMPGPVHEGHLDVWHQQIALNATAVYLTCGAVAAHMVENEIQGSISLIAAKGGAAGGRHNAAYAASKSAALRVMESMAAELKEHRIRVNALSPSTVDTPGNRSAMGDKNAEKWVKPEEIANTLIFLASEKASAITGTNIGVFKWV